MISNSNLQQTEEEKKQASKPTDRIAYYSPSRTGRKCVSSQVKKDASPSLHLECGDLEDTRRDQERGQPTANPPLPPPHTSSSSFTDWGGLTVRDEESLTTLVFSLTVTLHLSKPQQDSSLNYAVKLCSEKITQTRNCQARLSQFIRSSQTS